MAKRRRFSSTPHGDNLPGRRRSSPRPATREAELSNFIVSYGNAAADAYPQRIGTTWADFVAWCYQIPRRQSGLTTAEYAALKPFPSKSPEGQRIAADKDGPYIVLADFGGQRRAYETLLNSTGVPLDFDGGTITADVVAATLQGFTYVAFTTYAHQPGAERWRVFVPTASTMDAATHTATWHALNERFGGVADPAAKDATRLSYLPGSALVPAAARIFHADGALFAPATPAPAPPVLLQAQADGPVDGWSGPTDDADLIAVACITRTRPDERFGGPVHFAMMWTGDEGWLAQQFPPGPSEQGQAYSRTKADMAIAGELAYWTGSDKARMVRLMRESGLRREDDDWLERKVPRACDRAIENATQWAFHRPAPPPDTAVSSMVVSINANEAPDPPAQVLTEAPPPPTEATANAIPLSFHEATAANAGIAPPAPGSMPGINDYWAYLPNAQFIHRPTGMLHVASSVDGTIGKDLRATLVVARPVHRMTWAPGYPERFQTRTIDATDERGADSWMYNKYIPPRTHDKVGDATPWLSLVQRLYPDDWQHIVLYFADAVQHADKKCNHALVLGSGVHGIGKDTLLAPVRYAVGERNFWIIKPSDLVGTYNPWVATRILQVSESRDLGEGQATISRYEMYERMKDLCAAPPTMLTCNDKYIAQHQVLNVLRPVLTTNHAVDGIYIPPEDRRHYCAWSDAEKMDEETATALWEWYEAGGMDWVANYLTTLDLSAFNRAAPPPQTVWWHQLVEGGRPAEDDRISDALAKQGNPEWVTLAGVAEAGGLELAGWMLQPGNRRKLERLMESAGYRRFPNPGDKRGRWYLNSDRVAVYRRKDVRAVDLLKKFNASA